MKTTRSVFAMILVTALFLNLFTIPSVAAKPVTEVTKLTENVPTEPFDLSDPEAFESGNVPYAEDTVLVKFVSGFNGKCTPALQKAGIDRLEYMFHTVDGDWYTAFLNGDLGLQSAVGTLRELDCVSIVEFNYIYSVESILDTDILHHKVHEKNHYAKDQWYLKSCGLQAAWQFLENNDLPAGGSPDIVVAVIDTGVDYDHQDLLNNMWTNDNEIPDNGIDDDGNGYVDDYYGVDMTARKGNGDDDHGHGTHVAGIIASANNNVGTVGVAYNSKIMSIKAGMASGTFKQADIAKAVIYAYENGADVINMSFGGNASSIAVEEALSVAYNRCILVAAAGNDGESNVFEPSYPAAYTYVLGVMSVDNYGKESSFTNYDWAAYDALEYELYAPGSGMMSTLPGDRYTMWNGTSMAAPVVSGMAALLRTYYTDREAYPTKFIYGQLAATSEIEAKCIHLGGHNLPQIANVYSALTKLPKPELGVSDYRVFDNENLNKKNNGDGVIDAGETVALGLELRNRWGMSNNTVVQVDATSEAGIACPYVEFITDEVNYGSIGTYSTQDAGKIMEDDFWIGWEKPFLLRISEDCPNDYIVKINISITSSNGLEINDTEKYTAEGTLYLTVRRGTLLPGVIDEDMTLTNDHYYILQSTTTIAEGVTLTIEEGTQVQFWTNDPNDAYAANYVAELHVRGTLLCKGTEEQPIQMFPSALMDKYAVKISLGNNGVAELEHTNITNPYVYFTTALNCTFDQNYRDRMYYRTLWNGTVATESCKNFFRGEYAESCVFKDLGCYGSPAMMQISLCDGCLFYDSAVEYSGYEYQNCVFYGNNNLDSEYIQTSEYSSLTEDIYTDSFCPVFVQQFRDPVTGSVYVLLSENSASHEKTVSIMQRLAECMGGSLVCIETEEELEFISENISAVDHITIGLYKDVRNDQIAWINGASFDAYIPCENVAYGYYGYSFADPGRFTIRDYRYANYLIELPSTIVVEEINFPDETVTIDFESEYVLIPEVYPQTAEWQQLRFFSSNDAVVTVDDEGQLTPVSAGTATVYVFSSDMYVNDSVEIVVKNTVPAKGLYMPETLQVDIDSRVSLGASVIPENSTKNLIFSSSAPEIASVNTSGMVRGNEIGKAVITAQVEGTGFTASTIVSVVQPVETIAFEDPIYITSLNSNDNIVPIIKPANATNQKVIWRSSNPEICYVDGDGQLVRVSQGTAVLKATVEGSDRFATITVCVTDQEVAGVKAVTYVEPTSGKDLTFALLEDGSIWFWGASYGASGFAQELKMESERTDIEIENIFVYEFNGYLDLYAHEKSGAFYRWEIVDGVATCEEELLLGNVKQMFAMPEYGLADYDSRAFLLDTDGYLWSLGRSSWGSLGVGSSLYGYVSSPLQVVFPVGAGEIVDLFMRNSDTYYLDDSGNLYQSGSGVYAPELIATGFSALNGSYAIKEERGHELATLFSSLEIGGKKLVHPSESYYGQQLSYYIDDEGFVYISEYYSDYEIVPGMENVKQVLPRDTIDTLYFITEDGKLYGKGANDNYELANGTREGSSVPVRIYLGLSYEMTPPSLLEKAGNISNLVWDGNGNIIASTLEETTLRLDFDMALYTEDGLASVTLTDSAGNRLGATKALDLNSLVLERVFMPGETYTVTLAKGALVSAAGIGSEALTVTFTCPAVETDEEVENEGHVHIFVTETVMPTTENEGYVTNVCGCGVTSETVLPMLTERGGFTQEQYQARVAEFVDKGYNTLFWNNALLNRTIDDDVRKWLRILAPEGGYETVISMGGNYWGTTNKTLINHQIVDADDFSTFCDINEGEILTNGPVSAYPFVVDAYLTDSNDNRLDVVGNEELSFIVEFNRDMDTTQELTVRFGSYYPYADYEIVGEFVDERTWVGNTTLKTIVENGYQYWSIDDGRSAADEYGNHLKLYKDWGRFGFAIDTTSAMAMIMQGYADDNGIMLTWYQDDYDTLAGYNVYRSDAEDGNYTKLNPTIIPADTTTWFDTDVEPGKQYYYTFTVLLTDMNIDEGESTPAGKICVTAKDTMAPSIYHSPIYTAVEGKRIAVTATVTDNVAVDRVTLYYRTVGGENWSSSTMESVNDKYTGYIPGTQVTTAGIEYYIEATDGISNNYCSGHTAERPYSITVLKAVTEDALGDVNGDGMIDVLDAMLLLQAANDNIILTDTQFLRADIDSDGILSAKEALRILMFANGKISSVLF